MDCSKLKTEGGEYTVDEVLDECPKCYLINDINRERVQVKDGVLYCEFAAPAPPSTPPSTSPPTTGTTTPPSTGSSGGSGSSSTRTERTYNRLNLHTYAQDPTLNDEYKKLYDDLGNTNMYVSKLLRVQQEPNPDNAEERIVLWGKDSSFEKNKMYVVEKGGPNNEYGWINTDGPTDKWMDFNEYAKARRNESVNLSNVLTEGEDNDLLPKMIDDKLREFNFYSADKKGKQKIVFTDEDREKISKEFDDLIKKYPEDIAFIRSVVIAKGEDKKTGEPIVRLGSYYNNANIELPFNSQMNGLGKLLDGGIIYFTVLNNEGPDYRDFELVAGDKIPEVDFNDKEKEEIETDTYVNTHSQKMEKEEPFEEVMKKKEKKGLESLINNGKPNDDLTKKQKEVLENLKKKGFKFDKPKDEDIYNRVRVSSKEFNETIKAWKPK